MTIKLLNKNIYKYYKIQKKKKAGRNNKGQIVLRYRGGGIKHFYKPTKMFINGYITFFLGNYSSRNNFLNITSKNNKSIKNNLHTFLKGYDFLDYIKNPWKKLKDYDSGTFVSHIQHKNKIMYCKASGSRAQIVDQKENETTIKLPSNKLIHIKNTNFAFSKQTINFKNNNKKAGYNRWLNKRPRVRGVAMNPVDHPHGGGEGRTSGGRPSVSRWGWYTK